MKLTEKMAYLQGLIEGLDIDTSTKEGKVLMQMSELMKEVVVYVDDLQSQVDELTELCDNLDEDLGDLEREVYNIDDELPAVDVCCVYVDEFLSAATHKFIEMITSNKVGD